MWTGIPVFKLTEAETKKLIRMEEELHKRVIGQEVAITAVSKAIRRSRAGIKDPKRPSGSFIFLGPSGVGKTELARTLAEFLFGDEEALVRIDMSEYMEKHAVSRLVGSPPGYIGYDEGGQLTEAVRRKPYSVLLLDEIEKAHPDVFNILLQILEDGRLTDAQGRTVDFRNAIVIMTSNIGASEIAKNTSIGFTVADETGMSYGDMKNRIMSDLKKVFRPEFLNRIDEVIVFHKLAKDEVKEIVDLMINRVRVQVAEHELQLELTDESKDLLVEKGWDPSMGARPLRRAIQRYIEDPLADEVLRQGPMVPGSTVHGRARRLRRRGGQAAEADDRRAEEAGEEEAKPKPEPEKVGVGAKKDDERRGRRCLERRCCSPAGDGERLSAAAPTMREPGRSAIGTWSGGRFLRFGEAIEEERLEGLLRPGEGHRHRAHRRHLRAGRGGSRPWAGAGRRAARGLLAWSAPSGMTSTRASATGRAGFPASPIPACAGPSEYAGYLRMAAERSLERLGAERFDLLLLHNPDRIGYSSEAVWDGMAALREAGLTGQIGVAPGPRQRLHPRPDLLHRALRRADRLGDDHPQPVRALARASSASTRPPATASR